MKRYFISTLLIMTLVNSSSAFGQAKGRPTTMPTQSSAASNHGAPRNSTAGSSVKGDHASGTTAKGTAISDHPKLVANLQTLLPPNTDMKTAADGFKNFGQFVAAVHVSHNLGISFDDLKAKMVTDKLSLGKSIESLKPEMTKDAAEAEAKKGEMQAKEDTKTKS